MKSFQKITTIHTVVTERIEDALITAVRSEGFFLNKEAKDESGSELQFKSKTKTGAESETENGLKASPECEAEPEEKAESAPDPEAEIRVGSEEETAPEPEAESGLVFEREPDAGFEFKSVPEPEEEVTLEPEEESAPDPEEEVTLEPEEEVTPNPDEDIFESDFLEGAPEWMVRKIQRREIAELARCEWRLANNHFLTHGYYNYHHLALLENDEQLLLGVPGIYHRREAAAAETFGFPRFIALDELAVELSPEERNEDEKFGYWCRSVRRPVRREQTRGRE